MAIIRGAHDWLFLTDGSNDTLAYSTGQRRVEDHVVSGWHRVLESRHAWLAQRGISMYTFIVPNKEVVYADRLPPDVPPISKDRPVQLLRRRLEERSDVTVEYPLEQLITARNVRESFPSDDSHWNAWGAFVFYREAMMTIADEYPGSRILDESEVRFADVETAGDLGSKLDPPRKAASISGWVLRPRSSITFDNQVLNNGHLCRTRAAEPTAGPKVMFFHDSFHMWARPFFADSFPETVSAHNYRLDFDLVERERPDIIVVELTERFLVRVPDDADGMTTEELWLAKQSGQIEAADGHPYLARV